MYTMYAQRPFFSNIIFFSFNILFKTLFTVRKSTFKFLKWVLSSCFLHLTFSSRNSLTWMAIPRSWIVSCILKSCSVHTIYSLTFYSMSESSVYIFLKLWLFSFSTRSRVASWSNSNLACVLVFMLGLLCNSPQTHY